MIVGVDPGKDTGVAVFKDKKLIELHSFKRYEFILWFQKNAINIKLLVLENSKLQSHIFTARNIKKELTEEAKRKIYGKMGRNVGEGDGFCEVIEEMCKFYKIECKNVSPLAKGKKITHETFIDFVPYYNKQTNQHKRDAAQVVMRFNYEYLQ